jgi:aminopeptidase
MTAHQRNLSVAIDPVKLDRLAEVAIKVGLQLREGQDLLLTAPVASLPLVRRIAEHAYKAGAGLVTTFFSDEEMTLARYRFGHDLSFDRAAGWLYQGMAKAFSNNTARLAVVGDNPMLLSGEDPSKVARASKANSIAYQPALEKVVNFDTNWNIIAYPSTAWAKQVFPDDAEDVAIVKLADAIFSASRVDNDGAVANWKAHNAKLRERTEWLNGQRFHALKYSGPGMDLTINLADGHESGGRRFHRQQRHHLQCQHPDRGSLHHAAFRASTARGELEAAILPGHADRQHPGQVRGRTHRRCQGFAARKC